MTEIRPTPEAAAGAQPGGEPLRIQEPQNSAELPYTLGTHDALFAAQAVSRPSAHQTGPTVVDRHAAINAAHLMLGILAESGSTATRAFTAQGVPLGRARMRMAELTLLPVAGRADGPAGAARPDGRPLLPPIDVILEDARAEAARLAHPAVGTGHLLLALSGPHALHEDLEGLGMDASATSRFVVSVYADRPPRPRTARETA